jgi:hypothetical protein
LPFMSSAVEWSPNMTIVPILCLFFWHEGACQGMRVHEEELRLHYLQIRLTLVL